MPDNIAYRVRTADLSMERLWNQEFEEVNRELGPHSVDELKKYLAHVPRLELEISL